MRRARCACRPERWSRERAATASCGPASGPKRFRIATGRTWFRARSAEALDVVRKLSCSDVSAGGARSRRSRADDRARPASGTRGHAAATRPPRGPPDGAPRTPARPRARSGAARVGDRRVLRRWSPAAAPRDARRRTHAPRPQHGRLRDARRAHRCVGRAARTVACRGQPARGCGAARVGGGGVSRGARVCCFAAPRRVPARRRARESAAALSRSTRAMLVVEGPSGSGRVTACAQAAGRELLVLDLAPLAPEALRDALTALGRECLLRDALPVLANVDQMLGEEQRDERRMEASLADHLPGPLLVTSAVAGIDLGTQRAMVRIPWAVPTLPIRRELRMRAVAGIGARAGSDYAALAHRYRVGPGAIQRAVASVQLLHPPGATLDEKDLVLGLRHNIAERLAGLAQRVEVTQSWDDLVIAEDIRDLISALIGRVRHSHQVLETWGFRRKIARGTGVPALFSGPPGTGKTMVAGLIARALDLELYQVALSKVVSKWVGETEKNLGRVFDAAEEGQCLLLFD